MVCFKFLHPKFSNNTNKHKLKSNLQKLEFSKHLVQLACIDYIRYTFNSIFGQQEQRKSRKSIGNIAIRRPIHCIFPYADEG